jgi:hypothetical protein
MAYTLQAVEYFKIDDINLQRPKKTTETSEYPVS